VIQQSAEGQLIVEVTVVYTWFLLYTNLKQGVVTGVLGEEM
jgi:hypothetical protein